MKTPEEIIDDVKARVSRNHGANNGLDVVAALDAAGYEIKRKPLPNGEYQKIGALARAKSLSPERRSEIARNAARARWDKKAAQTQEARQSR